ncbi:hypothetical protein AB2B38_005935 [Balneola sp. MJW-20]|uniref:hypothetical protein n=1 Tax=Gracilimonas aurantiaca TaxID=3234185 RepID=UPI0034650812
MNKDQKKPWLRQSGESPLAYDWFQKYLFMGPSRTMRRVVIESDIRSSYINQLRVWSKKHPWRERAQAYDDYLAIKKLEEYEKSYLEGKS